MAQLPEKATHQQTRAFNLQLVLKAIYDHDRISRADIARLTGLTRATVSELVMDLLNQGLILEVGLGQSTGGKTPTLLSLAADSKHLIAIDLANDAFIGAIVDLRGAQCHRISRPLENRSGSHALKLIYTLIDELLDLTDRPLLGISIGTPGLVDTEEGIVLRSVHLGWDNLPLGQLLEERYNLPVYIANDSQVAALAQYIFGEEPKSPNLVAIKLGQGIGSGIVINGVLFQGEGFGAGEIGHVTIIENGQQCRCGNFGCLETVATEHAMLLTAEELAPNYPGSILSEQLLNQEKITSIGLFEAYRSGDELASLVANRAAFYLGLAIANLVGVLNLHNIWLIGDITHFGEAWLEEIRNSMKQNALPVLAEQTQVNISALNQDVVILGTSALLITRELGLDLAR